MNFLSKIATTTALVTIFLPPLSSGYAMDENERWGAQSMIGLSFGLDNEIEVEPEWGTQGGSFPTFTVPQELEEAILKFEKIQYLGQLLANRQEVDLSDWSIQSSLGLNSIIVGENTLSNEESIARLKIKEEAAHKELCVKTDNYFAEKNK